MLNDPESLDSSVGVFPILHTAQRRLEVEF